MEVKRICQWCGKPFIAQKTTTCYCSPQCSKRGYKHRMMERKMELRHMQEMQELRSSLEKQEYFTFSQAARLMGVSRQYIYKLVKEEKLRASRLSGKMSLIRKADIELMLKSKPYERLVAKNDFDITEYYTAEEIAQMRVLPTGPQYTSIGLPIHDSWRYSKTYAERIRSYVLLSLPIY